MKKPAKKVKRVQICPKCKSPDIETDFSNAGAVSVGHFVNLKKCNNCGHNGTFFPTIPISKLKSPLPASKVKNNQHFDTSFAKGYFGLHIRVIGFFFILMGLVWLAYQNLPYGATTLFIGIIFIIFWILRKNKFKS